MIFTVGPFAERERPVESVRVKVWWSDDRQTIEGPFTRWFCDMYIMPWLAGMVSSSDGMSKQDYWAGRPARPVRALIVPVSPGGIN